MNEKLIHQLWRERSRGGRAALLLVGLLVALLFVALTNYVSDDGTGAGTAEENAANTTSGGQLPPPFLVRQVNDGDTITLEGGDRVRLVQIDAPELLDECYGRNAKDVLRQLLPEGTRVGLVRDPRLDDRDKFGRLLRYVMKGSLNVNLALVEKGAASVYFFHGDRGSNAAEFLGAAQRARAAGRGAWGACKAELAPELSLQTYER
ncbi:MAG: thermonuclease family protein [Gaiellaceae bacterium]